MPERHEAGEAFLQRHAARERVREPQFPVAAMVIGIVWTWGILVLWWILG